MHPPDSPITSYGEWSLLNGNTSPEDLDSVCQEFFPFVYHLALILLGNPITSRRSSLEALAKALHESHQYPGGDVHAWLAHHTIVACCRWQPSSKCNCPWPTPCDSQGTILWRIIHGLVSEIQIQAVLFYRFGLSVGDIARACSLPTWTVENNLILVKELCYRHLLWAGVPASQESVGQSITRTLAHQLPGTIPGADQEHPLAQELAHTLTRKEARQRRLLIFQQALIAVVLLVVLVYLYLKLL